MSNKRIHKNFNTDWENDFLVSLNINNKCICLVCNKQLNLMTKNNIEKHFKRFHEVDFGPKSEDEKKQMIKQRKIELSQAEPSYPTNNSGNVLKRQQIQASYVVAQKIAKKSRPFSDGEFIQECCVDILNVLGCKGQELSKAVADIPLSRPTITRRIEDISENIKITLKRLIQGSPYISLALDESTDICDTAQLIIAVRFLDLNFNIHEELLSMVSLHGRTTAEIIYESLNKVLAEYEIPSNKISAICTDGARTLVGKNKGWLGYCKKITSVQTFFIA